MIWFAELIPLLAIIVLAAFFAKKVAWWEYLILGIVPLILIGGAKQISISSQTKATEYWNSFLVKGTYLEPWDEYIHQTCTRTVSCGKNCTTTETYDCSYVAYHPPQWFVVDNIGQTIGISRPKFDSLCRLWNNKVFKDLKRNYYHKDGDEYSTAYKNDTIVTVKKTEQSVNITLVTRSGIAVQDTTSVKSETLLGRIKLDTTKAFDLSKVVPACITKNYENKVRASKSLFNFEEVTREDVTKYDLKPYPREDVFGIVPLIGYSDPVALDLLRKYNALLGSKKKLHMFILVFKDKPLEAGIKQRSYWKGGNKNEFTLCIGIDKNKKIKWTKVISWSDKETLKARVSRTVKEMDTLNLSKVVTYLKSDLESNFEKKNFRDFDYITVEPTLAAVITTYILVLLLSIGWAVFSVRNEFDLES